jgi:uncharacterized protein (DUF1778 family)
MPRGQAVLSVRVSADERDLLARAAEQDRTTLSDFIRRKAIEGAEMDLLDRRVVTIPAAEWDKFEAWAAAPPREVPALRALAAARPAWEG